MYSSFKCGPFIKRGSCDGLLFTSRCLKRFQFLRNTSGFQEKKIEMQKDADPLFSSVLQQRFEEAKRSVIIRINSNKNWQALYNYCSEIGTIEKMFHYSVSSQNYVLIEMQNVEQLKCLLNHVETKKNFFTVRSMFLSFEPLKKIDKKLHKSFDIQKVLLNVPLSVNIDEIIKKTLLEEASIDEQIISFYHQMKIPDLGIRLRFLTCLQIQTLISGFIPDVMVIPFGSSVSGFGLNGSDLDFVAVQNSVQKTENNHLIFKAVGTEMTRPLMQSHLSCIYIIMKKFMFGIHKVNLIKNASVPIVKFNNKYTGLDCDLSLYQVSGIQMTEILYTLSLLNNVVTPLVFNLRIWAKKAGLTSDKPGTSITNFSLTLLVLFFLQQKTKEGSAVLPPVNKFFSNGNFISNYKTLHEIVKHLKEVSSKNNISLETLLESFFLFYSNFDFHKYGCCLKTGSIIKNCTDYSMYIINFLEPNKNVSKNIVDYEVTKFKLCCNLAYKILKTGGENNAKLNSLFNRHLYTTLNSSKDSEAYGISQ